MSEKPVEQIAEEHAEWFVGIITPMIKSVAITFFEHGYKHGCEFEQKEVMKRLGHGEEEMSDEGEFKKHIIEFIGKGGYLSVYTLDKVLDEARKEFYLALKHLKNRDVESPYLESVVEKWFGEEK